MESSLISHAFEQVQADALVTVLFAEEAAPAELAPVTAWLDELRASGEFAGKPAEMAVLHQPSRLASGLAAKRLVVVSGGGSGPISTPRPAASGGNRGPLAQTKGSQDAGLVVGRWRRRGCGGGRDSGQLRSGPSQDHFQGIQIARSFFPRCPVRRGGEKPLSAERFSPEHKTSPAIWRMSRPIL